MRRAVAAYNHGVANVNVPLTLCGRNGAWRPLRAVPTT